MATKFQWSKRALNQVYVAYLSRPGRGRKDWVAFSLHKRGNVWDIYYKPEEAASPALIESGLASLQLAQAFCEVMYEMDISAADSLWGRGRGILGATPASS